MSFPFIKQYDSMDCGPACLAMVCKFWGNATPLQLLRDKAQIGKEGVSLLGISEAAEEIGFSTRCVQLSFSRLTAEAKLPAILHWNQNHFVVLYKTTSKNLFIADPSVGLITYDAAEFKKHWISNKTGDTGEGIALLLEPNSAFDEFRAERAASQKQSNRNNGFKVIFRYAASHRKLFVQLFIGVLISSVLQLILPFLSQSIVDVGINTANLHFVYIVLVGQIALFIGRLMVDLVRSRILLYVSTRINVSILTDFLIKLMKLPMSFFESKKTGDIMQRMNDHQRIESFLTGTSLNVFFSLLTLATFSVILWIYSTGIFVVFAIASVVYGVWVMLFLKYRKQVDYKRFELTSKEQGVTIQMIQGMQEIKLQGCEKTVRWNWEGLQARLYELNMKVLNLNQWQQSGAFFINEGKNILISFFSASAVINGQMTLGSMIAVQYIIGQLNSPIEQMVGFVQSWQNAQVSFNRLNEIHQMDDEEPSGSFLLKELPSSFSKNNEGDRINSFVTFHTNETKVVDETWLERAVQDFNPDKSLGVSHQVGIPEVPFGINVNNVTFSYPGAGNEPVLTDINFYIPAGKTTALVGVSGSGKTTMLKLLLKFYKPQKGDIGFNNTSLENISHKTWRSHCGVVMQDSVIFSDSIAMNIAVGQEKVDIAKLEHALMVANLNEFIENLPVGYNTKIGSEGMPISMGQKQRVLIARAVYRNPEFILFDEATNSLDANNEKTIIQNLASFFKGRTVIVVAHRLSTVKHADQIVLLNKGRITEKGTHQELINIKGAYYKLVKNQLQLG